VAVAKPFVLPTRARKRGNPNWGRPIQHAPYAATAFEEQVQKLGLTEQTCVASTELRQWCKRNKDRCYIPEWLLKRWGLTVDPNVTS
jgi:hypothetical protein